MDIERNLKIGMAVIAQKHTLLILSEVKKLFTYSGAKVFCSTHFGLLICVRFA